MMCSFVTPSYPAALFEFNPLIALCTSSSLKSSYKYSSLSFKSNHSCICLFTFSKCSPSYLLSTFGVHNLVKCFFHVKRIVSMSYIAVSFSSLIAGTFTLLPALFLFNNFQKVFLSISAALIASFISSLS